MEKEAEAPQPVNPPPKRRRLSRKEQKARKKRKKHASSEPFDSQGSKQQAGKAQGKSFSSKPAPVIPAEQDLRASYLPTPIPTWKEMSQKHQKCTSLGKWFPKAVVLKSSIHYTNADMRKLQKQESETAVPTASILLFYQYVDPQWPASQVDLLIAYLINIAEQRSNLGGRIRVAREGLNVTLSAADDQHTTAYTTLRHFVYDLQRFDPQVFAETDFKYIDHVQADRHFKDLKIFPVQELVFYGFGSTEQQAPLSKTGVHLQPTEFHQMLSQDETVVIDVRNHYEAALGRFDGQQANDTSPHGAAEYIDPRMRKSTDFSKWLAKSETQEKLQDKNVLMFCTGGVRCERASAHLNHTLGSKVKGVYQLQGGIERYLQQFPHGGHWRGKNFVFDKREACGAGDIDGDGGVVERRQKEIAGAAGIETKCCICDKPWDRYVGKKKCSTCGVPVLMCDACMSNNQKKESEKTARCPLCVEENVAVPVEDVEWTNNGIDISKNTGNGTDSELKAVSSVTASSSKAAPSVLKWGGGHASNKKSRRRFQGIPCRFGADCRRKDCFFAHPRKSDAE